MNTMTLTRTFLRGKSPCADGFRWFVRHHHEGDDYQSVLDGLVRAGRVSVYSPVGAALLGLRVGERARWHTPNGDACEADIVAVLFQPEASGEYAR